MNLPTRKKVTLTIAALLLASHFSLCAMENEVWISPVGPASLAASGNPADPFRCPDAAALDAVFQSVLLGTNLTIHLMPGIYNVPVRGIVPRPGWKIRGAGMDNTVLRLAPADFSAAPSGQCFVIGGRNSPAAFAPASGVEVSDLTVDCNLQNQKNATDLMAVCLAGSDARISRVKAINWGTLVHGLECFVLVIQPMEKSDTTNALIEDCVVTQPAPVQFGDGATAITIFNEVEHRIKDSVIRNNLVYGVRTGNGPGQPQYFHAFGATGLVTGNRAMDLTGPGAAGIYRDSWNGRDIIIENNVCDQVDSCLDFNMQSAGVNGVVIKNNVFRPAEGGTGLKYYTGELANSNRNAFATNLVIVNNVIYPSATATNVVALSLNGRISATVTGNVLQGGGTGCDLFINWHDAANLRFHTWSGNVNLAGTQLVEGGGGFLPGEEDTIKFRPRRPGWYRIFKQGGYVAGNLAIHSEAWNNAITDDELWFRVNSYNADANAIGEIVEERRGGYPYPFPGNVTAVRIVSDHPQSSAVFMDVYIPKVTADAKEIWLTVKGPNRPRLLPTPELITITPALALTRNL